MEFSYIEKTKEYLDSIAEYFEYEPILGSTLEETILNTIVGTLKTTRLGRMPIEETRSKILEGIKKQVDFGYPIAISSAWGAIKTATTKRKGVDLAEYLTLKQYSAINRVVKKIYEPGVVFNIYLGDAYYEYLYGYDAGITEYCKGMKKLAENLKEINIVGLGELYSDKITEIKKQCDDNYILLKEYWYESDDIDSSHHDSLASFSKLIEAKWVGKITPAMREFYLKRMSGLYPQESIIFWTEKTLRFFAYGLMVSQNDLMGRKNTFTSTIDACLLRVPPPDMPRNLYSNRIRMRVVPESISKHSAPPWTVVGALCVEPGNRVTFKLLNNEECKNNKIEYIQYKDINVAFLIKEESV